MTEQYPYDPDEISSDDRVHMTGMDILRVCLAFVFAMVGLVTVLPMIPGFVPAIHAFGGSIVAIWHYGTTPVLHLRWHGFTESGPIMGYRVAAGLVSGAVLAFSLRHGWGVAISRGLLVGLAFVVLRIVIF